MIRRTGTNTFTMQQPINIPTRAWPTTQAVAENITIGRNVPFTYLNHTGEHFAIALTRASYRQAPNAEIRNTCDASVSLSTCPTVSSRSRPTAKA